MMVLVNVDACHETATHPIEMFEPYRQCER